MRASGRSVLLTSRMTGSFASSALRSTKRVCGSGPSARVDEQHDAVDHGQAALDLAAEVGVAGGVDDVDGDRAVGRVHAVVRDRGVLREDRDALLALELVRVHGALFDVGVVGEGVRLLQHRVDERRLAVVDVGDDRDVAQVVAGGVRHGGRSCRSSPAARTGRRASKRRERGGGREPLRAAPSTAPIWTTMVAGPALFRRGPRASRTRVAGRGVSASRTAAGRR